MLISAEVRCCHQVRRPQHEVTTVKKRYSQFERLRKDLEPHSKSYKALEFPKKKRLKGKRGGKKDAVVDVRAKELVRVDISQTTARMVACRLSCQAISSHVECFARRRGYGR
jgi:hypothetical protein